MDLISIYFVISFLAGLVVMGIGVAVALAYIRRTLQLVRADEDGSKQDQVLDAMERIEIRLSVMSDRLGDLEEGQRRRLGSGDEGGGAEAGPTSE